MTMEICDGEILADCSKTSNLPKKFPAKFSAIRYAQLRWSCPMYLHIVHCSAMYAYLHTVYSPVFVFCCCWWGIYVHVHSVALRTWSTLLIQKWLVAMVTSSFGKFTNSMPPWEPVPACLAAGQCLHELQQSRLWLLCMYVFDCFKFNCYSLNVIISSRPLALVTCCANHWNCTSICTVPHCIPKNYKMKFTN